MLDASPQTEELHGWLVRMRAGDPAATDELVRRVGQRLEQLTRHMLRGHPALKRWTQTDDVLQGALLRLLRALRAVQPGCTREFFALAAQQVRRELIDLARHYYGPRGLGTHHLTPSPDESLDDVPYLQAVPAPEPGSLAEWCDFHGKIEQLSDEQREIVGLLFYQGLSQAEAAEVLDVTVRTVQRRWHAALVSLHDALNRP